MTDAGGTEATASPEQPASLFAAFQERARSDSGATFVSTLDGGQWTYGQLSEQVDELAEQIRGVPYSPVIGAYGGNNPVSVIALLAAWQAGRCLACVGRQVPADAARPLFEMAGCAAVLAEEVAPFAGGPWQTLSVPGSSAMSGESRRAPDAPASAGLSGIGELACVCFTSGTTGKPKAVTMTHRHLVEQAARLTAVPGRSSGFRPRAGVGRPVVSFSPFGHNGFHSWLGLALWLGRGLVLIDKFSVDAAVAAVARFSPPTLTLTPTMIQMLANTTGQVELPGVKSVTSSTAPLAPDVKELFSARFGIPILQAYGMTEFGNVAREHLADVLAGRQPRGSVGRVSPGREVRIVGDDGAPLGPDEEGKLLVRATGRAAAPDEVAVGPDGWFDTGDRGALTSDGILIVSGRTSDRIIVGGFNVVPAEVELEIRASGLVIDAVVVGLPDDRLGEVPVAGVVWKGDDQRGDLLAVLRDKVAHYKLPREFFTLPEVPRTPYGKVDRKRAAELARTLLGPSSESLLVEKVGDYILHVTLNRPDRLNAVNRPMRAEMVDLWQSVKQRTDIRCIVVTGAGTHAFCVGMDLKSLVADGGFPEVPERLVDHVGINPLRHELWTPLVVAVNGVCTGAGLQLVADADIVVASTNASFLDTHVSVGQVSALEPIALVPRIGLGRTLKMCLLGKNGRIEADEALRIGLVDELVAPEELHARSLTLAGQISAASPNAVRLTKQAIRQSAERPQAEAEQYGWDLLRRHRSHPDAMEGPQAFVEERPPSWSAPWLD